MSLVNIPMPWLWKVVFLSFPVLCLAAIVGLSRWHRPHGELKVLKYLGIVGASGVLFCSLTIARIVVFSDSEEVSHSVEIPGYRVEFYEGAGHMNFDVPRYFNVISP